MQSVLLVKPHFQSLGGQNICNVIFIMMQQVVSTICWLLYKKKKGIVPTLNNRRVMAFNTACCFNISLFQSDCSFSHVVMTDSFTRLPWDIAFRSRTYIFYSKVLSFKREKNFWFPRSIWLVSQLFSFWLSALYKYILCTVILSKPITLTCLDKCENYLLRQYMVGMSFSAFYI